MQSDNYETDALLSQLRQEFIEAASDHLDDIEIKLDMFDRGESNSEEDLFSIQRHIHNIKGQGATFGFPQTGRVAHMLEDYLINANGIRAENIADVRIYLGLMVDLISTEETIAKDDPQSLLNSLPTGQVVTFSTQQAHDINVLLVMPAGLQRKMVAKELLSCGFRVMRAYNGLEALSVAVDIMPDIVFVNYDIVPFNGLELSNMFASVGMLSDIHFVLLTSLEEGAPLLKDLSDSVSVVQKNKDFRENIGELLIQWGVFGNVPLKTTESGKEIRKHPKTVKVVKHKTQRSLNILAAEDNPINQQLIKATVEAFGHRIEVAENGLLAVEMHNNVDFDLILMDVNMPVLNGIEATQAIRKLSDDKSRIPIIAVTADAMNTHQNRYFEAGMDACVTKPIDRAKLLEAINRVMGEDIHVREESEAPENEHEMKGNAKSTADNHPSENPDADIENFMKHLQGIANKYDDPK